MSESNDYLVVFNYNVTVNREVSSQKVLNFMRNNGFTRYYEEKQPNKFRDQIIYECTHSYHFIYEADKNIIMSLGNKFIDFFKNGSSNMIIYSIEKKEEVENGIIHMSTKYNRTIKLFDLPIKKIDEKILFEITSMIDNIPRFLDFVHDKIINDILFGPLKPNDADISKICIAIIEKKLGETIIYDSTLGKLYFLNKYGFYKSDGSEEKIRKLVYTNCVTILRSYVSGTNPIFGKYMNDYCEGKDGADRDRFFKRISDNTSKLFQWLTNKTSYDRIVDNIKNEKAQHNIYKLFDKNRQIIAFENGIYDFSTMEFRKPRKDEFISLTTGYDFNDNVSNKDIDKIMKILNPIFDNEELLTYVLDIFARAMSGFADDDCFYEFIGKGSNGKSILRDLIYVVFGDYYDTMSSEYLSSSGNKGSSHDAHAADKKNCRISICSEPKMRSNGKVDIRSELLKKIGGRDFEKVRAPYAQKTIEIAYRFKLIILTNSHLEFIADDIGMTRKMRSVVFPNQFFDENKIDKSNPTHKLMDRSLKDKITKSVYRDAFMHILIERVKEMKKYGKKYEIKIPKLFEDEVNDLIKENDITQHFIDENIIITGNPNDFVPNSILGPLIERFLRINQNDKRTNVDTLKKQMKSRNNGVSMKSRLINRKTTRGMQGIKIKEDVDLEFNEIVD